MSYLRTRSISRMTGFIRRTKDMSCGRRRCGPRWQRLSASRNKNFTPLRENFFRGWSELIISADATNRNDCKRRYRRVEGPGEARSNTGPGRSPDSRTRCRVELRGHSRAPGIVSRWTTETLCDGIRSQRCRGCCRRGCEQILRWKIGCGDDAFWRAVGAYSSEGDADVGEA